MTDTAASPPKMLGRYELVQVLGQGGMGEVFLARISGAAGFEKPCIVKTILPGLLKDPQFLDRFHHEAKVLVHLVHSNIAQVYDMGEESSTYFMALEYVAGVDLSHVVDRARATGTHLPVPFALYVGQKIAEGLGYAHRKASPDGIPLGIVHRDVSPHNVMMSYEGEVKVIDFGLAKSSARSKHTLPSTVMGKLGYMSPEQVRGETVDRATDIYALGVVIWELLAGRPYIPGGTMGEMMAAMMAPRPQPLTAVRPDVDPALDAVVARALAPQAKDRYARAEELARALGEQLSRLGQPIEAEEAGNFVKALCPEAYAHQRKLISRLTSLSRARSGATPLPPPPSTTRSPTGPVAAEDPDALAGTLVRSPAPAPASASLPAAPPLDPFANTAIRSSPAPAPTSPVQTGSPAAPVDAAPPAPPRRRGWVPLLAAVGVLGAVGAGAFLALGGARGPLPVPVPPAPAVATAPAPLPTAPTAPTAPAVAPVAAAPAAAEPAPPAPPEPAPVPAPPAAPARPVVAQRAAVEAPARRPSAPEDRKAERPGQSARPEDWITADLVVPIFLSEKEPFTKLVGLAVGDELKVVGPRRGGKHLRLGTATVMEVWPGLARLALDVDEAGASGKRYVVAPEGTVAPVTAAAQVEGGQDSAPVPAEPAAPQVDLAAGRPKVKLMGSVSVSGILMLTQFQITNTNDFPWTDCQVFLPGRRSAYFAKLGSRKKRTLMIGDFRDNRSAEVVPRDRLHLVCQEGRGDFRAVH